MNAARILINCPITIQTWGQVERGDSLGRRSANNHRSFTKPFSLWRTDKQQRKGGKKKRNEENERGIVRKKANAMHGSLVRGPRAKAIRWCNKRATSSSPVARRNTGNKIMRKWLNSIRWKPLVPIHFSSLGAFNNVRHDNSHTFLFSLETWIAYPRFLPEYFFASEIKGATWMRHENEQPSLLV